MTAADRRPPASPAGEPGALGADAVDLLREAIGRPERERIAVAVEEIQREILFEDLAVLMITGVTEAVRAFFDVLVQLDSAQHPGPGPGDREGGDA